MKITVVIPTSNRPDFLFTALESVVAQTAFDYVDSIFVSDNGDSSNEDLVRKFPKVKYVHRKEKSTAFEHGKLIWEDLKKCSTPLVAMLHDDDWWTPTHLENALKSFSYENVAYYSNAFFQIKEDEKGILEGGNSLHVQAAMKWPTICCSRWLMTEKECLLASMLGTFTHYSTMVMKTKALLASTWIYEDNLASHDNDRRLQFILSKQGNCIYNPVPAVFVRQHSKSDAKSESFWEKYLMATTGWLVANSKLKAGEILKELVAIGQAAPQYVRPMYLNSMRERWVAPELLWLDSLEKYDLK